MPEIKRKMSRSEWLKTPYAKSTATRTDEQLAKLLARYGVADFQWTQGTGPSGRPAIMLRFVLKAKPYRILMETLDAMAEPAELMTQVKRAMFYSLKSLLEASQLFIRPEQALFAFLELPEGQTVWEAALPMADRITAPALIGVFPKMLPRQGEAKP